MDEYQHPLFFEAQELTDTEIQRIRRHFQIRRCSGGGDCGVIEKVGDNTYKICFKEKEDQERVLQKEFYTISLPSGELHLTVSQTNPPQTPKPSDQPSTSHSQIEFLQNVHQQHSCEVQRIHISDKKEQAGGAGELTQDNCDSSMKTGFNRNFAVQNETRIVVLGKTGAGKSSLANTIFGEPLFKINHSPASGTSICQAEIKSVNGNTITWIDTPGFFCTGRSEEDMKPEVVKCITECAPGPHAFLIVLKVEKYTVQEKDVIKKINQHFSEEAFKYAAVVFTHGDQLSEGVRIEEFVSRNEDLSDLVKKCGGRCHVFDNKYWKDNKDSYSSNQFQVAELLKTIEKISEANNGSCYTNEMLEAVKTEIQREEEQIRQSSGNMTQEEIKNKAKINVSDKMLVKLSGVASGALLVVLLGVARMVTSGKCQFSDLLRLATTAEGIAMVASDVIKGSQMGYNAAEGAETMGEAVQKTVKAVLNQ